MRILFSLTLLGAILGCFGLVFAQEIFTYQVIIRGKKVGTIEYHIERGISFTRYTSFFPTQDGRQQRDAEFWLTPNGKPLLSRKWLPGAHGETFVETRYHETYIEVWLRAPQGRKKMRIKLSSPVFDLESLPFCRELWEKKDNASPWFSVFIPVSGMIWKGKRHLIAEKEAETVTRFSVAGEAIIVHSSKEDKLPQEIHFPERGYSLYLSP